MAARTSKNDAAARSNLYDIKANRAALRGNQEKIGQYLQKTGDLGAAAMGARGHADNHRAQGELAKIIIEDLAQSFLKKNTSEVMQCIGDRYRIKGEGGKVDWAEFGRESAVFYRDLQYAPVVSFMYGPLQSLKAEEKKVAQKKQIKIVKEEHEATYAEDATDNVTQEKAEAVNSYRSSKLRRALMDMREQRHAAYKEVKLVDGSTVRMFDMVEALFDPWSYSHTVENLFYFSFNVKQGWCGVYHIPGAGPAGVNNPSGGWPHIMVNTQEELSALFQDNRQYMVVSNDGKAGAVSAAEKAADPKSRSARQARDTTHRSQQTVVEIDMESWAKICKAYGLKKPLLAHRRMPDCCCPPGAEHLDDSGAVAAAERRAEAAHGHGHGAGAAADADEGAGARQRGRGRGASAAAAAAEENDDTEDEEDEEEEQPPAKARGSAGAGASGRASSGAGSSGAGALASSDGPASKKAKRRAEEEDEDGDDDE